MLFLSIGVSQKNDYTWLLGDQISFTEFPYVGISVLKFKDFGKVDVYADPKFGIYFDASNSCMSDSAGNFLFAFNEYTFQNNQYGFFGEDGRYTGYCIYSPGTDNQNIIIIPKQLSEQTYHVLYNTFNVLTVDGKLIGYDDSLRYALVDMKMNSGKGMLLKVNEKIMKDTLEVGKLVVVKHANGKDWWLIKPGLNSKKMYRFLISEKGIKFDDIQLVDSTLIHGLGQAIFSPDGNYYCNFSIHRYFDDTYLDIFKFDRVTGLLSNQLHEHIVDTLYGGGVAISPNSRFVYVSQWDKIYQYDLQDPDPIGTKILVAAYDGYYWQPIPNDWSYYSTFGAMALAPDGRIYIASISQYREMSVIQYPDRKGLACEVRQHGFYKPTISLGVPNNPNPRLGPIDGSPADTLGLDNLPVANFRADQDSTQTLHFQFQDLSYYEPATWSWDFGDGTMSSDTSPVHSFPKKGTYVVCLTVANANGMNTACDTLHLGTTSIDENKKLDALLVYPNPANSIALFIMNGYYPQKAILTITDEKGSVLKSQRVFHGWNSVDVSNLASGMYYYSVEDSNVLLYSGKLMKQ